MKFQTGAKVQIHPSGAARIGEKSDTKGVIAQVDYDNLNTIFPYLVELSNGRFVWTKASELSDDDGETVAEPPRKADPVFLLVFYFFLSLAGFYTALYCLVHGR